LGLAGLLWFRVAVASLGSSGSLVTSSRAREPIGELAGVCFGSSASHRDRSVPLGKYCRSGPLVARCGGLCGSAKETAGSVSARVAYAGKFCAWPQGCERRSCLGSVVIVAVIASFTASVPPLASAGPFFTRGSTQ